MQFNFKTNREKSYKAHMIKNLLFKIYPFRIKAEICFSPLLFLNLYQIYLTRYLRLHVDHKPKIFQ